MSRYTDEETDTEQDPIRIRGVFKNEALLGETDSDLRYSDGTLHYQGPDETTSIDQTAVTETRVDRDKSVSGFRSIAYLFAIIASLMGYLFTDYVLLNGGGPLSVVGLGTGLSTILAAAGVPWLYRLDADERIVLHVNHESGERVRFITTGETDAFQEIERRLQN
ncbi:hypothetical protein U3A55_07730 [Salarchaeum sp. III]|uniref:hypothetical protein n=1 Tax=Salarchaeum sp. III TaxID=3107927 RepID=UPI002ED7C476